MDRQRKENYLSRFNGLNLSEEALERQWRARLEEEESLRIAEAINIQLINQQSSAQYFSGGGGKEQSSCLQMVFETENYDTAEIDLTVSADTTYTIDWGDGATDSGTLTTGSNQISHTYTTHGAGISYSSELCFGDPSAVTELNFVGDD